LFGRGSSEVEVTSGVAGSWARIDAWLRANGLPPEFSPPSGVTEEAIRAAEATMGLELPEEVRESYRSHDGSRGGACLILFERGFLMPLQGQGDSVVASCLRSREIGAVNAAAGLVGKPDGPIRPDYWSPRWVPLTCDWESDTLAIDLAPAEGGCIGQVILHSRRGETRLLGRSWGEWLAAYADALEAGEYRLRVVYEWLAEVRPASEPDDE
jgi:cell wall assembly regulator SMI1